MRERESWEVTITEFTQSTCKDNSSNDVISIHQVIHLKYKYKIERENRERGSCIR